MVCEKVPMLWRFEVDMPRRPPNLEPSSEEREAHRLIKQIQKTGGVKTRVAQAPKFFDLRMLGSDESSHRMNLPPKGVDVRFTNGRYAFRRNRRAGRFWDYLPIEFEIARYEAQWKSEEAKLNRTPPKGVKGNKGQVTRQQVIDAWNASSLPTYNRASRIAKALGITPRHVRRIISTKRK